MYYLCLDMDSISYFYMHKIQMLVIMNNLYKIYIMYMYVKCLDIYEKNRPNELVMMLCGSPSIHHPAVNQVCKKSSTHEWLDH